MKENTKKNIVSLKIIKENKKGEGKLFCNQYNIGFPINYIYIYIYR